MVLSAVYPHIAYSFDPRIGGGAEGVQVLTQKLKGELEDTISMCGVHSLSEITRDLIF